MIRSVMIDVIHPRWLIGGAIAAFILAVAGLYAGWSQWAPIALLAGEMLTILAAIVLTTPGLQQSERAAATTAAATTNNEHTSDEGA
jgi:hypothetical protein